MVIPRARVFRFGMQISDIRLKSAEIVPQADVPCLPFAVVVKVCRQPKPGSSRRNRIFIPVHPGLYIGKADVKPGIFPASACRPFIIGAVKNSVCHRCV